MSYDDQEGKPYWCQRCKKFTVLETLCVPGFELRLCPPCVEITRDEELNRTIKRNTLGYRVIGGREIR